MSLKFTAALSPICANFPGGAAGTCICSWTCWCFFLAASSSASEKASRRACCDMSDSSSSNADTLQYWPMKLGQYALKWTARTQKHRVRKYRNPQQRVRVTVHGKVTEGRGNYTQKDFENNLRHFLEKAWKLLSLKSRKLARRRLRTVYINLWHVLLKPLKFLSFKSKHFGLRKFHVFSRKCLNFEIKNIARKN